MFNLPADLLKVLFLAVPGFVAMKVFGLLVPGRRVDWSSAALEALAYGAFNIALWYSGIEYVQRALEQGGLPWWGPWFAFFVLFVSPAALSVGFWRLRSTNIAKRWLAHPLPTAWDYFFEMKRPCWMLFKLRNGSRFGAYFGKNSFASSFPEAPDLYVEDVWRVDEHGRFSGRVEGNMGAVVRFAECEELNFYVAEESHV